jgi:hypothetical protein
VPIDDHQIAAVVKRPGWLAAFCRVGDPEAEIPLGAAITEIGRDPHVMAGLLPHGTTGVAVQDRKRRWHEASVGRGAWLGVLPQRAGVKQPPFAYLGPDGRRFTPEVGKWAGEFPYEDIGRYEGVVLKWRKTDFEAPAVRRAPGRCRKRATSSWSVITVSTEARRACLTAGSLDKYPWRPTL